MDAYGQSRLFLKQFSQRWLWIVSNNWWLMNCRLSGDLSPRPHVSTPATEPCQFCLQCGYSWNSTVERKQISIWRHTRLRSDRISFSWTKFRSESVLRLLTSWSAHTWLSVNCVGEWKKNIHQIALLLQYRNFDELRVYRQKRLYHWRKIGISKLMLNNSVNKKRFEKFYKQTLSSTLLITCTE